MNPREKPMPHFLDLPSCPLDEADAVIVPVPLEKTVSYGRGTAGGPAAILEASTQIELFDEETLVDFENRPRLCTLDPMAVADDLQEALAWIAQEMVPLRDKFTLVLGGEHTLSYAVLTGLVDDPARVTIVQIDAHADLIDRLDGRRWSHGTVMRRLWEQGCRLVQIGIRSLSREEYNWTTAQERIDTYYGHQLAQRWPELLERLAGLEGDVYLSVDVDGLDPTVIPNTGTPQPGGLSWFQTMEILRTLMSNRACRPFAADLVELVPSPHPPGCDLTAARLAAKVLAFWAKSRCMGVDQA